MKIMNRRLLALVLTMALFFSLIPPMPTFAEEEAALHTSEEHMDAASFNMSNHPVNSKRPFPQAAYNPDILVTRVMPTLRTQADMDNDVVLQFEKILQDFIVDPHRDSFDNPETFRMVLSHPKQSYVATGPHPADNEGRSNHYQITCSESMGYGMLMLAYLTGSEDVEISPGVKLRDRLKANLPEALRANIEGDIDIQFYYDAMMRSVMYWPAYVGKPAHAASIGGTFNGEYRRTHLMAWELLSNPITPGLTNLANNYLGPSSNDNANAARLFAQTNGFYSGEVLPDQSHSVATDGDMDMAYAMLVAHAQWGSNGDYDYLSYGKGMINDLWYECVDLPSEAKTTAGIAANYHLLTGNWADDVEHWSLPEHWVSDATRTSDHMLQHLKVFNLMDDKHDWQLVIDATHEALDQLTGLRSPRNGLVPDFALLNRANGKWSPAPTTNGGWLEGNTDGLYNQNACRVPWRLGVDWMLAGSTPIDETVTRPLHHFLANAGNRDHATFNGIRGYNLDGTTSGASGSSLQFVAPVLVTSAIIESPEYFGRLWEYSRTRPRQGNQYGDYINVLAMVAASGNWWSPADRPSQENELLSSGNRRIGADIVLNYDPTADAVFAASDKTVAINGTPIMPAGFSDNKSAGQITISAGNFPNGNMMYTINITGANKTFTAKQYVVGRYSENLLRNGNMETLVTATNNGWTLEVNSEVLLDVEHTTAPANDVPSQRFRFGAGNDALGTNPADVQLYQDVLLEANRTYTLYITARANAARNITVEAGNTRGEPVGGVEALAPIVRNLPNNPVTGGASGTHSTFAYTIESGTTDELVRINLLLGQPGGFSNNNRDIYIREIKLVETVKVPIWEGEHPSVTGWWVVGNGIRNSNSPTTAQGIGSPDNPVSMDMSLLGEPNARLFAETVSTGTSANNNQISGVMVRRDGDDSSIGSGVVARTASGHGVAATAASGSPGQAVFKGDAILGAAVTAFGPNKEIDYITLENNTSNGNGHWTLRKLWLTHDDIPRNPDTVMVGVEMNNAGKTVYQLGEELDLSATTINMVYESGRREIVPVTADMVVGFATAVTSAARPLTVVYPNTEAAMPFITGYDIQIEGASKSLPPKRPFPQAGRNDSLSVKLLKPTGVSQSRMNADVIDKFKQMIKAGEFLIDPPTANDPDNFRMVLNHNASGTTGGIQVTTSESMGYGMIILAMMAGADEAAGVDVQAYFDGMLRSIVHWPTAVRANSAVLGSETRYLMTWELINDSRWKNKPFRNSGGSASTATDGSIDMAYAMLLAHEQWGSDGRYNYLDYARKMINEIFHTEVHAGRGVLTRGNWDTGGNFTRPSDHIMYALKAFAEVDSGNDWQRVIDVAYAGQKQIMELASPSNGLLPDFVSVSSGANGVNWTPSPPNSLESVFDGQYHWNACRVPWRLGVDRMLSGVTPVSDLAVRTLNDKTFEWSGGDFNEIYGRDLDGRRNDAAVAGYDVKGSAFSAPFVVTSAIYGPQEWFDAGWAYITELPWQKNQYGDYIALLTMLAASGNEWSPVAEITPAVISITTQPAISTRVTKGQISGSLTVTATLNKDADLGYQWFVTNAADGNTIGTAIENAESASFAIPTGLSEGLHYYFVKARAAGAEPVRSDVALVTVHAPVPTQQPVPIVPSPTPTATETPIAAPWKPNLTAPATPPTYNDVDPNAWHASYIARVASAGVFHGTGAGRFAPEGAMSRAMFVQVLANLDGADLSAFAGKRNFSDVQSSAWYSGAVEWAASLGIAGGTGQGRFAPDQPVTREQIAVMLARFIDIMGIELPAEKLDARTGAERIFADQHAISSWAAEAVAIIQAAGIMQGRGNGFFDPQAIATRAEVAVVFARLLDLVER